MFTDENNKSASNKNIVTVSESTFNPSLSEFHTIIYPNQYAQRQYF